MRRGAGIYLVTRIHGLRTHLIVPSDLQVLVKAKGLRGVYDALMKADYSTEISQLPAPEQDASTFEEIFLKKLVERFFFVRRAAQGKMQDLLTRYCARFEVENIKRILRAKHGYQAAEVPSLIPLPREYSLVNFPALLKAKDVDEIASLLRDTPYHAIAEKVQSYRDSGATILLEASLDNVYFSRVWEVAGKMEGVRDLIGEEIDLRNLLVALSLKARGIAARLMEDALIPVSYALPKPTLHSLLQSRLEDAPSLLTPRYSMLVADATKLLKSDSTSPLEWLFFNRLYGDASATSRTDPLRAGYIAAYLLLCECEAKNLVSIVTGKQLKLSDEEISKGLFAVS
jgi:vacuolar-type H+-ATPase subunit C/Vma6